MCWWKHVLVSFFMAADPGLVVQDVDDGVSACHAHADNVFDTLLCSAIAYHESRFDPQAVGPTLRSGRRAVGMLQVIPHFVRVERFYGRRDIDWGTPDGSVAWGRAAFHQWYDHTGSVELALCHYAGGNTCVMAYARRIFTMRDQMVSALLDATQPCGEPH